MIKKIKRIIEKFSYINRKINPSILASSLTFYLLIAILPFYQLILYIIQSLKINDNLYYPEFNGLTIKNIIYIFSTIWACSKFINTLHIISDIIFFETKERPRLKLRILSFIYTLFLLIIIVLEIVLVIYFGYLKQYSNYKLYLIMSIVEVFFPLIIIASIFTLLYKYIIPIKIKISQTWKTSLVITVIVYILLILYQKIFNSILISKYVGIYGSLANVISLVLWIYLNCYIFLVGMTSFFIKNKYI